MKPRRVAITGIGAVSALGNNVAELGTALREGRCGIEPIEGVDRSRLRFQNGAEARRFRVADHLDPKEAGMIDRFAQLALVAAREAMRQAGLEKGDPALDRAAVITGSCVGGQSTEDDGFADLYLKGRPRVNPLTIPKTMANAGASRISREFGIHGAVFTISTACSSSNHAIGLAFSAVRSGASELAITGGSEAMFSMGILKAWEAMRVVSPDTCRPFSKQRKGLILGEAGAMLVLEPLERARARGARILGEIAGFGMSSDAHHLTQPSVEGPVMAVRQALDDAGIGPEQIGYINAHGTGTAANDPTETKVIRRIFGERAGEIPVSSTKSLHGHTLGAAGALEAVATLIALNEGFFPPTANFLDPDPECDLDVVPNRAREGRAAYAMSNSFAFGGLNAVLVIRAPSSL